MLYFTTFVSLTARITSCGAISSRKVGYHVSPVMSVWRHILSKYWLSCIATRVYMAPSPLGRLATMYRQSCLCGAISSRNIGYHVSPLVSIWRHLLSEGWLPCIATHVCLAPIPLEILAIMYRHSCLCGAISSRKVSYHVSPLMSMWRLLISEGWLPCIATHVCLAPIPLEGLAIMYRHSCLCSAISSRKVGYHVSPLMSMWRHLLSEGRLPCIATHVYVAHSPLGRLATMYRHSCLFGANSSRNIGYHVSPLVSMWRHILSEGWLPCIATHVYVASSPLRRLVTMYRHSCLCGAFSSRKVGYHVSPLMSVWRQFLSKYWLSCIATHVYVAPSPPRRLATMYRHSCLRGAFSSRKVGYHVSPLMSMWRHLLPEGWLPCIATRVYVAPYPLGRLATMYRHSCLCGAISSQKVGYHVSPLVSMWRHLLPEGWLPCIATHVYVAPSPPRRLATMYRHSCLCGAISSQKVGYHVSPLMSVLCYSYQIFIHVLMSSVHVVLAWSSPPLLRLPQFPSNTYRCIPSCMMMY